MLSKKVEWFLIAICACSVACSGSTGGRASTSTGGNAGSSSTDTGGDGGSGGDNSAGKGGSGGTGGGSAGSGGSGGTGGTGGSTGGTGGDGGAGGTAGAGGSAGDGGSGGSSGSGGTAGDGGSGGDLPDAGGVDAKAGQDTGGIIDPGSPPPAGCTLRWSPSAMKDGAKAFEGLEMPDMNGVHPGAVHFSVVPEHDAFRVDQHYNPPSAIDYDHNAMDRLRCETKGMNDGTTNLQLLNGQTWRIDWSLFVPSSLKASTRFNHIWQMKYVTTGGTSSDGPVLTLDLTRQGGVEKIRIDVFGQSSFAAVNLIHDKWISTSVTIKIAPGTGGSVHWTLKDGATVLSDSEKTGISTWPANTARLRPKWGIYRSLGDLPDIETTYILISDLKGYSCP